MNENLNLTSTEEIQNLIYTIRGKQVMLDSDVARLFKYTTKDLNRNVKNNINRFPENYCFQITEEEYKSLRYKNFPVPFDQQFFKKHLTNKKLNSIIVLCK